MDSSQRSDGVPPLATHPDREAPAGDPVADLLTHVGHLRAGLNEHFSLLADRALATVTGLLLRGAIFAMIMVGLGCMTLIGTWFLVVGTAAGLERLIGNTWSADVISGLLFMLLPVSGLVMLMRRQRLAGLRRAMRKTRTSPAPLVEPR